MTGTSQPCLTGAAREVEFLQSPGLGISCRREGHGQRLTTKCQGVSRHGLVHGGANRRGGTHGAAVPTFVSALTSRVSLDSRKPMEKQAKVFVRNGPTAMRMCFQTDEGCSCST